MYLHELPVVPYPQGSQQIYLKSKNGPIEVYLCPEEGLEDASPVKNTTTPRKDYPHHPLGHTATPSLATAPPQYTTIKQEPQYTDVKQEPVEGKLNWGGGGPVLSCLIQLRSIP